MDESKANAERRHFWRAGFHAPAQLTLPDGVCECELADISLKGALLLVPGGARAAPNQHCQLRLTLGNGDEAILMQGTIVHVDEGRWVGLSCDAIDIDSITHLRRLVQLNAGDAALLDRELTALLAHRA